MSAPIVYTVVVPVYRNAESVPALLDRLAGVGAQLDAPFEVVFVVDGSPDESHRLLAEALPAQTFSSQLLELSRNFGAFAAIRTGIAAARGEFIAVMAADLQEPPELVLEFFALLRAGNVDVAVGRRTGRSDPGISKASSAIFWGIYRRFVFPDMPPGGVDIFACTRAVAHEILSLRESNSSLVGLLYWVGYRRAEVPYERRVREHGESGWSFRKKVRYLLDSVFSFTDLPLTVLITVGVVGGLITVAGAIVVLISFLLGAITEPGYTPLMLVILFSTFSLLVALGIVGSYVWRAFENTKGRPSAIVMTRWISDDDPRG
jgi:polyisoprenyl-phosphate glycosyltransferase